MTRVACRLAREIAIDMCSLFIIHCSDRPTVESLTAKAKIFGYRPEAVMESIKRLCKYGIIFIRSPLPCQDEDLQAKIVEGTRA